MSTRLRPAALRLIFSAAALVAGGANAATITQSKTFDLSYTAAISPGVNGPLAPSGSFDNIVNPFDASLGTLNSFSSSWTETASGTANGSVEFPAGIAYNAGGNLKIAGGQFNFIGGGEGAGGASPVSFSFDSGVQNNNFSVPYDATYDPAIYAAVTGLTPFASSLVLTNDAIYVQAGTRDVAITARFVNTVTYDYTPAPAVPEPATWTMMLAGFGSLGAALRARRRPTLASSRVTKA